MVHNVWCVCGIQSCTAHVRASFFFFFFFADSCFFLFFCQYSGAAYLGFLVQWFAQCEEPVQERSLLLSHCRQCVGNGKCITDSLLWFHFIFCSWIGQSAKRNMNTAGFLCNITQSGKIVTAFCCLACWGVGYESVIKPVMLFRLGALKLNMPRNPTKIHVNTFFF